MRLLSGEKKPAVVADLAGQPPGLRAIEIHSIEIQIPIFHGRPDDRLAVRRHVASGVVAWRGGQALHLLSIDAYSIEIIVIQGPAVGPSRFGFGGQFGPAAWVDE